MGVFRSGYFFNLGFLFCSSLFFRFFFRVFEGFLGDLFCRVGRRMERDFSREIRGVVGVWGVFREVL